jgi:hypothetical protein
MANPPRLVRAIWALGVMVSLAAFAQSDSSVQTQDAATYVDEIVATMNQRKSENRSATQAFLDEMKKQNDLKLSVAN